MRNPIGNSEYIQKKVEAARQAVEVYPAGDVFDLDTTIIDLIGDLLHYAEAEGSDDPEALLYSALRHYHAEGGSGHPPDDIALTEVEVENHSKR